MAIILKKLPQFAKNFRVTELELTGLLVNIHGFMQLLCNRYFKVLDHKAIEYMIKSKMESSTTTLKTLLLKLSEYTIDLKYLKGSEMHTSDALSRLQNIADIPDNKDVIPLNFLQHLAPNYIEHTYSHLVENFYVHKTKSLDTTQIKRKCGRPPKPKPENLDSNLRSTTAATKIPSNDKASRELVSKINVEHVKSDRLTATKSNTISKPYKQDYNSKLMMEKYLLLPINPQQLTPAQTALQRMSEKHPDFEIQTVNTIRPPDIEYAEKSRPLVPVDTPLSIIRKHILRQSDINKIVKSIETCMIHGLELPIQAQDLIKANQTLAHFWDIYHYITDRKLPSGSKAQNCILAEALNNVVVNNFLFRIDTQNDKDKDKGNLFLLVIPEKYEPVIFNTYHDSLLVGHQGPFGTAMTIRQNFFIHNLMNKVRRYIKACHICLKTKPKHIKMPQAFGGYHLLLVITCDQTNFTISVPLRDRQTQTIAEALIYRVIYLFGPPRWIVCDEAAEFTSAIIQAILTMLNCRLKVISPYNHGSSKCKRQIKTISKIIVKHLWDKGQMWPLFATTAAYAMNTFASEGLRGFSPFQLVFL